MLKPYLHHLADLHIVRRSAVHPHKTRFDYAFRIGSHLPTLIGLSHTRDACPNSAPSYFRLFLMTMLCDVTNSMDEYVREPW